MTNFSPANSTVSADVASQRVTTRMPVTLSKGESRQSSSDMYSVAPFFTRSMMSMYVRRGMEAVPFTEGSMYTSASGTGNSASAKRMSMCAFLASMNAP